MSDNSTNSSASSKDFWVDYYEKFGVPVPLVIMNGFLVVICLIGIVSNSMLVYVTAKINKLHGRCNILLALNSLALIPLLATANVKFFVLIFGINSIRLDTCYCLQVLGLIGAGLSTSAQLCIGFDRLISVLFPFWYNNRKGPMFLLVLIAFCCIRTLYLNCFYHYSINLRPEKQVTCSMGDMAQPEIGPFIYQEGLVLFCTEFLCYTLIWIVILCRNSQVEIKNAKKLMKSLSVIMGISFFCYIQGCIWRIILPYLHFDQVNIEYFVVFPTTMLIDVAFASNAPVLYIFSSEYRSAFRQLFFPSTSTLSQTWAQPKQIMPTSGTHQPKSNLQHA